MSNTKKIAILEGDGIGPETMAEGIKVLRVIEERNDITFDLLKPHSVLQRGSHTEVLFLMKLKNLLMRRMR